MSETTGHELPRPQAELAPSGISPWRHRVELDEHGALVLFWQYGGDEYVRTFTREETRNLLDFLYDWRHLILS